MSLDQVRAVADAVLYEGYLLYPYRATSRKNQLRWQFGVLGPPGAADDGVGEESWMATQCLLEASEHGSVPGAGPTAGPDDGTAASPPRLLTVHLRFLQLQTRTVERYDGQGDCFVPVDELVVGDDQWLSWDEAVEQEVVLNYSTEDLLAGAQRKVVVAGREHIEELSTLADGPLADGHLAEGDVAGRIVRRSRPLRAVVSVRAEEDDGYTRLEVRVDNVSAEHPPDTDSRSRDAAIRTSFIGTHLILEAADARFVTVVDPPTSAAAAARRCVQHRCWPVLTGERPETGGRTPGEEARTSAVVLASPIILYDFPEVAEQSSGDLFDSTEIDEILTLRVMTMTDEEKAEARATDPRAREIIDRCDHLSPSSLQELHGILRNPHADPAALASDPTRATDIRDADPPTFGEPEVPWWDPAADEAVRPELDAVVIDGVPVSKGSLVRVHPARRADAQDLFFADQVARVTAVLSDVDGGVHVALVLADDPAADLHDWYGRYWYFAPEELEPLSGGRPEQTATAHREESRS